MPKPRVTATDRLSNVIEVVELGRRSGLLAVERGAGGALEEGEIYFVSGRAIYAILASLRGREALTVLAGWGDCRFAFDPYAPRPTPNVSGVLPGAYATGESTTRGSRSGASWPGVTRAQPGAPASPPPDGSGTWWQYQSPFTPEPSRASGSLAAPRDPRSRMVPESGTVPPADGARGPGMPGAGSYGTSNPFGAAGMPSGSGAYPPQQVLLRRPRRAPDVRDLMNIVTTFNLSRGHRTILLLADGEHTLLDLARLSSKSIDEVSQLLGELEAYGLVYYYTG